MILRTLMTSLAMTSALAVTGTMAMALPAHAQDTNQTDQSEEDWRKSRKKRGSSDIYRDPNRTSTGSGAPIVDYEPVSPVERLPSESRRHLMRERAKAIAESDDGDISDAEYVPSEAAQSDEQLKQEEQEAWDVIVTDMEGSGGEAGTGGESGPNKVAVAGRNGSTPSQGSRGGSTRTLQEIMDSIKNGQLGSGGGSGQGQQGQGGQGQSQQSQSQQGQGQQGQGSDGQAPSGSTGEGAQQNQSDGSSSDGQDGQGDASQAQAGQDGDSASDGEQSGDQGDQGSQGNASQSGDSQASGDQSSDAQDADADSAAADAWPAATRAEEPLSPLERIRRSREERDAEGTQRSASDYLGTARDDADED